MFYNILDYFEETVRRHPDSTAFTDPEESISFEMLQQKAQRVAGALISLIPSRSVIGFYLDKGVPAIVGFLGAVYAGCAYSQLNPRLPVARIAAMLEHLGTPVAVTDSEHREDLLATGYTGRILLIEELTAADLCPSLLDTIRQNMLDIDPLYVNFTSGSTGTPKGVVVSHRNVMDFIPCFTEIFHITEDDVLANQAPFDFDVSVKDIYSGLFTGAQVLIIPTAYFTQPVRLMDYLCDHQVTVMVWAVSALCFLTTMNALDYRKPEKLRAILFSGEVMPIKHLKKLQKALPDITYVNLYGPTEITCNCSYYIVDREFALDETLPIGIPFPNERLILLGDNDEAVSEPGGMGELCVAGSSVALGYYRDPERTRQAFVQNPLHTDYDERIYRTGDLVRINERGEYVYVTRKDFQIKHMGHRIELGEIETALSGIPGVNRAVCLYLSDKGRILAFIEGDATKDDIVAKLKVNLPEYMIPNVFTTVEQMPLNKNGKIDRQALMTSYLERKGKRHG